MSTTRPRVLLAVLCVGYFLVLLDVTVVNVALPAVGRDLGTDVSGLQWVVDGYAVTLASLLLPSGTVGDVVGHRPVVLTGLAAFGVASAACAAAPATGALVAARVGQGLGAALLLPGTLAIIGRAFPEPAAQARAIGVWAGVGSAALPAGPLLGGLLVQGGGWRWVFALNVPIVLVAGLLALRVVPADEVAPERRLDLGGTLTGTLALAATTYAVIEVGRGHRVTSLVAAGVAVASLAAFVAVELRVEQPMLPLRLLRRPAFATANAVAGAMNLGTLGLLFVLTLYLQGVQDRSPLGAGVALLPLFSPLMVIAPVAGGVIARSGPRLPAIAGLATSAAGVVLLTTWTPGAAYLTLLPTLLLWGVGLGVLTPAVVAAAIAAVPADRSGLASGINNTARQAGGAVGIAAYGALAGPPSATSAFLRGLHVAGVATAALWLAAAVATAAFVTDRAGPDH